MTITELRSRARGAKIFVSFRSGVYLVSAWRGAAFGVGCAREIEAALREALR